MTALDDNIQSAVGWTPHAGQKEVLECKEKRVIVCAGRGWGKSILMAYIVFRELADALADEKPFKCFIIAPTYQLTEKIFEHFLSSFLLKYDRNLSKYVSGGSNRPYEFKYSHNVWIKCISTTEALGALGERVDLTIVDEAAMIPDKVFNRFIRELSSSTATKGLAYYISTPSGEGWFKNLFAILKEKGAAFQFKSTEGMKTEEEIELMKKEMPELLFRQEYLAEFVSDAGIVFRNLEKIIEPSTSILRDVIGGHFYTMGVDLAQELDYTVMTVFDTVIKKVVHIDRFKGRNYPLQKEQIIAKARRFNDARVIIDATGLGKPVSEDLMQAGIFVDDFTFSGKSKEQLINNLIVNVEEGYIRIPDNPDLIDEMKHLEYKYLNEKTGERLRNISYAAPQGYHDDCVMSLALAIWGIGLGVPKERNVLKEELKKRSKPKYNQSFF